MMNSNLGMSAEFDEEITEASRERAWARDNAEVIWGEDIFFCPLEIKVHDMDVLLLNKDRHIRTIYTLDQGEWNEQILTP